MVKEKLEFMLENNSEISDEFLLDGILLKADIINIASEIKSNYSHLIWFKIIYSFGLNISEFINLKVSNVDLKNYTVSIFNATGAKIRTIEIPKQIRNDLRILVCHKNPCDYLFEGRNGSLHMRTVQKFLKKVSFIIGMNVNINVLKKSLILHLLQSEWKEEMVLSFFGSYQRRSTKKLLREIKKVKPKKVVPLGKLLIK